MRSALLRSLPFLQRKPARCLGVLALAFCGNLSAGSVEARTPFMLENSDPVPVVSEAVPLELRGIVSTKSGYRFGIYDSTTHLSNWLGLDETGGGFTVRSHDLANETITAEFQGRTVTLALKSAKIGALPPMAPAVAAFNAPTAPALEGVMKEVERRRNLRLVARPGMPPQQGLQK